MSVDRRTMLARAARIRREPTEAERRFWWRLRAAQPGGHKFRRQATIGGRIVDFFCPAKALVIEIDGETHELGRDAGRDARMLADHGHVSLRFSNREVMENLDGVLQRLLFILDSLPDRWPGNATPGPSSEEEGRGLPA